MKDWRTIGHVGPEPPRAAVHRKRRPVPRPVVPALDPAGQVAAVMAKAPAKVRVVK